MDNDKLIAAICRPLVWREACDGNRKKGECFSARDLVRFAPITAHKKHDGWWLNVDCKTYLTLAAAQAAAEADYRACIAAALDLDKIGRLVEAAKRVSFNKHHGNGLEELYRAHDALDAALAELGGAK